MPLDPGARIGPYEIIGEIGAGGMGAVYRARDGALLRNVAIKVLPDPFASDPDRRLRFEREAHVLASLSHPNIAHIYGVVEVPAANGGVANAFVMELVEGDTLADRIARGPIPMDDALPIARQICEALEAAHAQGIIHRDLKPANIKVRPDGTVKVLDFGLAKALVGPQGVVSPAQALDSPTFTTPATQLGVILGTTAYMAPEQARGKSVDRRADMWAFGCVLFEMISGRRAFDGEDVTETLAAVVRGEPDWKALPPALPTSIQRLLRRCLEKDPQERLADAAAARLEIRDARERVDAGPTGAPPTPWTRGAAVAWGIAAASLIAATAFGLFTYFGRATPESRPAVRFTVPLPDGWTLGPGQFAVAPDGRRIALVLTNPQGVRTLWLRPIDALTSQQLTGTEGATNPFWSPDSRSVAFFAQRKLKRLDLAHGVVTSLCDAPEAIGGGTWGSGNVILFSSIRSGLQRIAATGGTPAAATTLSAGEISHYRPAFLADGRSFAFWASEKGETGPKATVYLGSIDSSQRTVLLADPETLNVSFAENHVLFSRGSALLAQRFDAGRRALQNDPVPLADNVQIDRVGTAGVLRGASFSVSDTALAYRPAPAPIEPQLVWLDRAGKRLETLGEPGDYGDIRPSPTGDRIAVTVGDATRGRHLWIFDVRRKVRTRFASDLQFVSQPTWSPDGSRLALAAGRAPQTLEIVVRQADGSDGDDRPVAGTSKGTNVPLDWSPDGRYLLLLAIENARGTLWALPVIGERKPFKLTTGSVTGPAEFSPDGRWVAYTSNESGRAEIWVTAFPDAGARTQVSTDGGTEPHWSRDGSKIFFRTTDGRALMAAGVDGRRPRLTVLDTTMLFEMRAQTNQRRAFAVSPDGQRFLINMLPEPTGSAPPLTVVLNWASELVPEQAH